VTVGGRRTHTRAEFEGWAKRRKTARRISFSGLRERDGGSEGSGRDERRKGYVLTGKTKRDREA